MLRRPVESTDTAPIGVKYGVRLDQGRCRRILEGVGDEFGAHVIGNGPADDFLRVAVDDRGQVDETLPRMDIGDVPDELHAGTHSGEIPCEKVGHVRRSQRVSLRCDPEWSWLAGHEALLTHHLAHQLGGTLCLLGGQVCVDSAIPVSALRLLKMVSDPRQKGFPAGRGGRLGARAPVVETRR